MQQPTYRGDKADRNLTRYTYERTAFQGWRVHIIFQGCIFQRYFPDRQFGGEGPAKEAALRCRDELRKALTDAEDVAAVRDIWLQFKDESHRISRARRKRNS